MAVASISSPHQTIQSCIHCHHPLEHLSGRFCGECGAPVDGQPQKKNDPHRGSLVSNFAAAFQRTQPLMHDHHSHAQSQQQQPQTPHQENAPRFAQVPITRDVPPEVKAELTKLLCLLARERLFLIMHCSIFLSMNLLGFFLSMAAYNGYNGDDLTRSIMALTPLMFINTIALACLAPINGTKREIARVQERLKFVRFQIEYHNLF